jgi:transforming growth factor-beta-induced protein
MKRMTRVLVAGGIAAAIGAGAGAGVPALASPSKPPTIVGLAAANPNLSTLVKAVQKAGYVGLLNDPKANFTVFAPTNDAFAALLQRRGVSSLDAIPADRVAEILNDHVLVGRFDAARLAGLDRDDSLPVAFGGLRIDFDRSPAAVNNAGVVVADVAASNGIVHVVDQVLLDPDPRPSLWEQVNKNPDLFGLQIALNRLGLVPLLNSTGRFTIFAPNNAAFGALLASLKLQSIEQIPRATLEAVIFDHVVLRELDAATVGERIGGTPTATAGGLNLAFSAGPLRVNAAGIVRTDLEARNGTIHVIDKVLLRPV